MLEGPQGLGHDKLFVYFFFSALCIAASLVVRLGWSFRTALISTRNLELTLDRESLGQPQSKRLADLSFMVPYITHADDAAKVGGNPGGLWPYPKRLAEQIPSLADLRPLTFHSQPRCSRLAPERAGGAP